MKISYKLIEFFCLFLLNTVITRNSYNAEFSNVDNHSKSNAQ